MEEEWKVLAESSKYEVSSFGRIRNIQTGNFYKGINRHGYLRVTLKDKCFPRKEKTFEIHRLVAKAFVDNPHQYNIINHIDGDKTNNRADNLEWCTLEYNARHSAKELGNNCYKVLDTETGVEYYSVRECSRKLGINKEQVKRNRTRFIIDSTTSDKHRGKRPVLVYVGFDLVDECDSMLSAAKKYGIGKHCIYMNCRGENKSTKSGYRFRYKD